MISTEEYNSNHSYYPLVSCLTENLVSSELSVKRTMSVLTACLVVIPKSIITTDCSENRRVGNTRE